MKKILLIVGIVFLLLFPLFANANEEESSSGDAGSCLDWYRGFTEPLEFFSEMTRNVVGNADLLDESFRLGNDPGQDLYLRIYQNVRSKPFNDTKRVIAERFGYTEGDIDTLMNGNLTPIYLRDKGRGLTVQEANEEYSNFLAQYDEELEYVRMQNDLAMQMYPVEVFANGSLEDSGFDLVYDLSLIEDVLFGTEGDSVVPYGSGSGSGSSGNGGTSKSQNSDSGVVTGNIATADTSAGSSAGGNSAADDEHDDSKTDSQTAGRVSRSSSSDQANDTRDDSASSSVDSFNPYVCLADESDLSGLVKGDTSSGHSNSGSGANDSASGGSASIGSGDDGSGVSGEAAPSLTAGALIDSGYLDEDGNSILTSSGGAPAVSTKGLCNDIFCLEINFVSGSGSGENFETDKNCVACHVDAMNKDLYATIRKSLLPSKITGNIFQPNTCVKVAGNNLPPESFADRILLIKKPVSTPPNDDMVSKFSLLDDVSKFGESLLSGPPHDVANFTASSSTPFRSLSNMKYCPPSLSAADARECRKGLEQKASEKAVLNASPSTPLGTTLSEVDRFVSTAVSNAQRDARTKQTEWQLQNGGDFYKNLEPEMNQMQSLFESYSEIASKIAAGPSKELCGKEDIASQ